MEQRELELTGRDLRENGGSFHERAIEFRFHWNISLKPRKFVYKKQEEEDEEKEQQQQQQQQRIIVI
jgi:hypothetical protein